MVITSAPSSPATPSTTKPAPTSQAAPKTPGTADRVSLTSAEGAGGGNRNVTQILSTIFGGAKPNPTTSAGRSKQAWRDLKSNFGHPGNPHENDHNGAPATAWPYGQTMMASLDRARLTGNYSAFNKLSNNLNKYAEGAHGYAPATNGQHGQGNKFYDDNAWIGLAYMQAYNQTGKKQYLNKAKGVFDFVKTGMNQGGLQWSQNEKTPTWNTCAEAPAGELAVRLHMALGQKGQNDPYMQFAQQVNQNMDQHLRLPSGLYRDNIPVGGTASSQGANNGYYTYNQGAALGFKTLLYQATGNKSYLQQAQQTAQASLKQFPTSTLMQKSPAFNAIYFRNLMQLNTVAPDPQYRQAMRAYAHEAWNTGRDPSTGLFDQGGIGHYGKVPAGSQGTLIDQAGMVQIYSILAMNPQQRAQLT